MDSVMSPATAVALGRLGGLGVLDLEGLWTRYEDPEPLLAEIASLPVDQSTRRMQEIYAEEIKPDLIAARVKEIRDGGVTVAGALTPQRTQQFWRTVVDAGVDLFMIRGTTVSAEHVSGRAEPLNLKRFIYELDVPVIVGGASTYTAALHLMRTGAAGVLVGFGGGAAHTTRLSLRIHPPIAAAGARRAPAPPRTRGVSRSASTRRWRRRSPTWPRLAATTWTSPVGGTCTSSPTGESAARVTSSRRSPAAPTR